MKTLFFLSLMIFSICCPDVKAEEPAIRSGFDWTRGKLQRAGAFQIDALKEGDVYAVVGGGFAGQMIEFYHNKNTGVTVISKFYPPFSDRISWVIVRKIIPKKKAKAVLECMRCGDGE